MVCFCGGREPGCAPGGAPSFLVSPRKEGKRRRPYCLRPLRCATGQPGVLGCGVRRVTHCAPAALRSDRRGESVDEARVCPAAHPRHPASCAPQAHTEGGWQPNSPTAQQPNSPTAQQPNSPTAQQPNSPTAIRAIAAFGLDSAARGACARADGAERSDGPCGCPVAGSLLCVPRSAGQGVRACAAGHTHFVH